MTMCAAITVPIIKDGYRLYPGMPVSSDRLSGNTNSTTSSTVSNQIPIHPHHRHQRDPNMVVNNRMNRQNSQTLYFTQQSCSPPDGQSGSGSGLASSPPGPASKVCPNQNPQRIIVGGAVHQVVLLQPRQRTTSNQSQISARSSFEVGPTQMNYWTDQAANRTAMSTSQLYIQKRRELCIQQQLQKQEEAKKLQQQLQQQRSADSINSNIATGASTSSHPTEDRKRKTSQGDHNNNSDESTNPFRKLLRRLGFGSSSATPGPSTSTASTSRHVSFEPQIGIGSDCESGIEQAVSASEQTGVALTAWH